jgi:hypothetical protein
MATARVAANFFAAFLLIFAPSVQAAQAALGRLEIKVVDPIGGAVPGAKVQVDHVNATTDSGGSAALDLNIGVHEVRISAPGFETQIQDVEVTDTLGLQVRIALKIWVPPCAPHVCVAQDTRRLPMLEPVDNWEYIPSHPLLNLEPLPSQRPMRH